MVTRERVSVICTTNSVGNIPMSCSGYEPTAYDHAGTSTVDTNNISVAEEIASNYAKRCNSVTPTTIIIWFWGGVLTWHIMKMFVCVCYLIQLRHASSIQDNGTGCQLLCYSAHYLPYRPILLPAYWTQRTRTTDFQQKTFLLSTPSNTCSGLTASYFGFVLYSCK